MNVTAFLAERRGSRRRNNRVRRCNAHSGNSDIWGRTNVFFPRLSRLGHLSRRLKLEHPSRPVSCDPQEIVRGQRSLFSGRPQSFLAARGRVPVRHQHWSRTPGGAFGRRLSLRTVGRNRRAHHLLVSGLCGSVPVSVLHSQSGVHYARISGNALSPRQPAFFSPD